MYHTSHVSQQILFNDEKNGNLLILSEVCKFLTGFFLTFDILKTESSSDGI